MNFCTSCPGTPGTGGFSLSPLIRGHGPETFGKLQTRDWFSALPTRPGLFLAILSTGGGIECQASGIDDQPDPIEHGYVNEMSLLSFLTEFSPG